MAGYTAESSLIGVSFTYSGGQEQLLGSNEGQKQSFAIDKDQYISEVGLGFIYKEGRDVPSGDDLENLQSFQFKLTSKSDPTNSSTHKVDGVKESSANFTLSTPETYCLTSFECNSDNKKIQTKRFAVRYDLKS